MRTFRRAIRPLRLLPLLALGGALLVGCNDGPGGDAALSVDDTGSGDKVDLSPAYEKGQSWNQAIQADFEMNVMGQDLAYGFTMDTVTTVDKTSEDLVTMSQKFGAVEVTDAPAQARSALEGELGALEGATLTSEYDQHGVQQGDSVWEPEMPNQQDTFSTLPAFPSEPVGEGAEWTVQTTMSPGNGLDDVEVETTYELVSLQGDRYELELTQHGEVSGETDGVEVSGDFDGSGTMSGTTGDPMPAEMTFTQDISVDAEGQTMEMTTTMSYTNS